jgi:two-component system chemotaxis response regulator CheY
MVFLVVDDSPTQRKIIIQALKMIGVDHVIEAENGLEGYTKLKEHKIDFILSDWNMPVLNGLEFVTLVRAHEKLKEIPIIMITTKGNTEDVLVAVKYKVNNYIVKPFSPTVLDQKIKDVLKINPEEKFFYIK